MKESELREIFNRTSGHCHFCGDVVEFEKRGWSETLDGFWEVDHVIQRQKGGTKDSSNCLAACTRCNRLRWHRTGEAVRELLFLGLLARDEIIKNTVTGWHLTHLRERRLKTNLGRRKNPRAAELVTFVPENLKPQNSKRSRRLPGRTAG